MCFVLAFRLRWLWFVVCLPISFMSIFNKVRALVLLIFAGISLGPLFSQEKENNPDVLSAYLPVDQVVKGNMVIILPPEEIKEYVAKVKAAAQKDPEWYEEYATKFKQGVPLPYHEKLGLTEKEYKEYRDLWNQRKPKVIQPIDLRLEALGDSWMIRFAAQNVNLTLLRYDAKQDTFEGVGGEMKRINDIESDPESMLGAWSGQEWKFEKESLLGKSKENFAIGKEKDGKHGLIVYRLKNTNRRDVVLAYENIVIRFPIEEKK